MWPNEPFDLLAQRHRTNDFRWATRDWNGSPYFVRGEAKSPKEIVKAVLESPSVAKVLVKLAGGNEEEEAKLHEEAKDILNELSHDFQMYAIRWFGVMLSQLGKKLYKSIQVNTEKLDEIKSAYGSYPVLLLPTHRSYVDFLLVSYLSFSFELTLPIIAAGMDFKGMIGIGEFLRKSGAFYIRRRFVGTSLYWALISEYIKKAVMEGGHPLELFVEGTRSRTGKSLKPKIGLLSIVAELVTSGQIPDVLIVPITMSYDRTLEERFYAHELLGKPKPKESTNGLLKALKFLGGQTKLYGSVYVNFGSIISVRKFLEKSCCPVTSIPLHVFLKSIQELALSVVLDHQTNLVVPIFAGIALILLSRISRGKVSMSLKSLVKCMEFFQSLLYSRHIRFGLPRMGDTLQSNIEFVVSIHSTLVSIQDGLILINCEPGDTVQQIVFQHYANQILNSILPFSFVGLLLELDSSSSDTSPEHVKVPTSGQALPTTIEEYYIFLRELFQEDFLFQSGTLKEELEWALSVYRSLKLSFDESYLESAMAEVNPEDSSPFVILRRAFEPYFIAYWGITMKLQEDSIPTCQNQYDLRELPKMCQELVQKKIDSGILKVKAYGALSLDTLTNGLNSLVKSFALERVKQKDGCFGIIVHDRRRLASISSRLERLMGDEYWTGNERKEVKGNAEGRTHQLRCKL